MRKQIMLLRRCVGRPYRLVALSITLLSLGSGAPLLANEEPPAATPEPPPTGGFTPLEEIPTIVPPPGKHQLKTSPVQAVEFRVAEQNKYLLKFNFEIRELQEALRAEKARWEAEVKELRESNLILKKQTDELTTQLTSLKSEHDQLLQALRNPRQSRNGASVATPRATPSSSSEEEAAIPKAAVVLPDGGAVHVIERGDNLISIARRYGTTVGELIRLNKIQDERKLQIGQTIILPAATPKPEKKTP